MPTGLIRLINTQKVFKTCNKQGTKQHFLGSNQLEKKLQQELESILNQEELLWFQKSREEWISGDRNTKFYHATTIIKNKRKKIIGLKTKKEEWLTENTLLEGMTQEYFQNLFKEEYTSNTVLPTHNDFP